MEGRTLATLSRLLDLLAVPLVLVAFVLVMFHAPTESTMGDVQRIFYFHVPSAMMALLGFAIVMLASISYLATGSRQWDGAAQAAAEVGLLFCTITLLTGPVWARSAWGVWWTWDARLSTTLVLWLLYVVYHMLRNAMRDDLRMRRFAAVMGILAALDVPIVYLSVRWWRTEHPQIFITERGALDRDMATTLWVAFVAILFLFFALFVKRLALDRLVSARDLLRVEVEEVESHSGPPPDRDGG